MNIADLIAALQRGEDPNQAIPAQFIPGMAGDNPGQTAAANPGIRPEFLQGGFMPPIPSAQAGQQAQAQAPRPPAGPPPAPPPSPPQGVATPLTNPQPPEQAPTITQSPPDLSNMYLQLIQKNQNAQALDSGLSLIAAGFSNNLGTRQALIQHAGRVGGGGAGQNVSAADLIGLQKHAQAQKDMLLRRSLIGGLAKQYNLTPEAALALETSGKLDEVIKHHETQNLSLATDNATGQQHFIDHRGRTIASFGGPKPIKGEAVKTEEGPTVFVDPATSLPVGPGVGGLKKPTTQIGTGPQGPQVINMETGQPVAPGIGQPVPDEMRVLAMKIDEANRERVAAGKPPLTFEQGARIFGKTGVSVNVGDQGQKFPAPPPGQDYRRTAEGAVAVDAATGEPTLYDLPGGEAKILRDKHQAELEKTRLEGTALQRKDAKSAEKDLEKARSRYSAVNSVFAAAENIENIIKEAPWYSPAVGFASGKANELGMRSAVNVRAQLGTIGAVTAFAQLQAMRDASETGAALGPVSDFENKMLRDTIASIDPNQDPKYVLEGVRRIKASMMVLAENNFVKQAGGDAGKAQQLYNKAISDAMAEMEKKAGPVSIKGGRAERIN